MAVGTGIGWPQPAQKLTPGLFCLPQLTQKPTAGAAEVVGVADACILWPQLVQNAFPTGTSVWQAGQMCVNG